MKDVTRLDDARFRGEPLNTPVEDRTLTPGVQYHWAKLTRAYDEFMFAVHQNSGKQPTVRERESHRQWRAPPIVELARCPRTLIEEAQQWPSISD